jgi:hypothetical protein
LRWLAGAFVGGIFVINDNADVCAGWLDVISVGACLKLQANDANHNRHLEHQNTAGFVLHG